MIGQCYKNDVCMSNNPIKGKFLSKAHQSKYAIHLGHTRYIIQDISKPMKQLLVEWYENDIGCFLQNVKRVNRRKKSTKDLLFHHLPVPNVNGSILLWFYG